MPKKEVFSKEYFLLQLQHVGAIKKTKKSPKKYLAKVRNISIGLVLAAFGLDEFSDQEVIKWIRKRRKLTDIVSEQYILYRNLAKYLMNNAKLKGKYIEKWKAVLDSPYVWPAKVENNDWCKLFGYVPDICQGIVGVLRPVNVASSGNSKTSSDKNSPGQIKNVEQISVSGLEDDSSKTYIIPKCEIDAKLVEIDNTLNNIEEILNRVSTTLNEASNITTTESDTAENSEIQSCLKVTNIQDDKSFSTNKRKLPDDITKDCSHLLGDHVPQSKQIKRNSVWFHYLNGDVNIPEICYNSVESLCKYEDHGCDRLHSAQHFHWQISEQGNSWYNLTLPQIKCLELAYCKPEEEAVTLERLYPRNLDNSSRNLLLLMGLAKWEADFNTMTVYNLSQQKVFKLRRLCTQILSGLDIDGNQFYWYFKDKYKKWIKYDNVDSTGDLLLKSGISSKDIEKHFKQNPGKTIFFNNCNFKYSLDFISMKQTNLKTNVAREVRRRPKPHLSENEYVQNKITKTTVNIPSTWELMQPGERVRMVNLEPSSGEYQTVANMFMGKYNITKIERIQNPSHYCIFEMKVQDMIAVYNNDSFKADVRQLFHGTNSSVIKSICSENFDWRLHGTSTGNLYGKGTYFSPDVKLSYDYCEPEPSSSFKYMFIARVAVGTMTVGDKSMSRPPINPETNMPYDTTVNNVLNPTIIVKYDKQEYYPEYIVTLKSNCIICGMACASKIEQW